MTQSRRIARAKDAGIMAARGAPAWMCCTLGAFIAADRARYRAPLNGAGSLTRAAFVDAFMTALGGQTPDNTR